MIFVDGNSVKLTLDYYENLVKISEFDWKKIILIIYNIMIYNNMVTA